MKELIHLLIDGAHGVYIPQLFGQKCNPENTYWVYSLEDAEILRTGPDHAHYWETWEEVLDNAYWQENQDGPKYHLYQNDDLWMIRDGYYLDDEGNTVNSETDEIVKES
jgi:hypothetical protein